MNATSAIVALTRSGMRWVPLLLIGLNPVYAAPDDVDAPKIPQQVQRQFAMDDANLEANLFNPHGNAKQARTRIESKLKLQLDEMHRCCQLTDSQRQKLTLAASTDIKRYFDEVEVVRKKYRSGNQDQEAWQNFWQEAHPLQTKLAGGLFGPTSFFAKTVRNTLTDDQFARYDALVGERRRYRYRSCVEVVMTTIENSVPLRHEQHDAIVNLLVEETQPPAMFGSYDQHVVCYYIARIPEAKLKPLLDKRQWDQLQNHVNRFRGMDQFLVQQGLLPKQEIEAQQRRTRIRKVSPAGTPADASQPENRK